MFDRREFLKRSSLIGVGTAATACAGRHDELIIIPPSNMTVADMESYLARLDHSMNALATGPSPMTKIFPPQKFSTNDPVIKSGEDLLRKNLRSLLLVGSFQDLPEEGRAYPGMQARMWDAMTEMDEAMRGMHNSLRDMTPTQRADIGRALKADPDLGMRIIEAFDVEAAAQGVPMQRRMHMRSLAVQVTNRLKQSSAMFIDEYVTKTQKVLNRSTDPEEVQRHLLATLGQQEFFALRQRTSEYAERWRIAQAGSAATTSANGQTLGKPKDPPGANAMSTGGILLGVGVILLIVGILVSLVSIVGAFGATVGALLALGGLITYIVGASIRAAST